MTTLDTVEDICVRTHTTVRTFPDLHSHLYNIVLARCSHHFCGTTRTWGRRAVLVILKIVRRIHLDNLRSHSGILIVQVRPGSKVLDVGCGVGGPMRNIAVFGDCHVQGITINQYQVSPASTRPPKLGRMRC